MKHFVRYAGALLCLSLSLFSVASGATAEFPNKPVRLIIPYPPGGGTDILARLVASKVSETMKWNIVTENRPGAGGSIGLEAAAYLLNRYAVRVENGFKVDQAALAKIERHIGETRNAGTIKNAGGVYVG